MSRSSSEKRRAGGFRAAFVAILFFALEGVSSASPLKQNARGQSSLSSRTDLVALPVSVTDGHGNFVAGLAIENFRVLEDGQPQNITFFEQENTPITVGLIVDHSGSMGPKLRDVAAAVLAFAHSSSPDDEMFVIDFADTVSAQLLHGKPFSGDPQELSEAVTAVSARGQTALYDAVAEGFLHIQLGHWNKRALIIVSDGGDNVSQHTFAQVLGMARSSHAVIYAIGLLSESGQEENPGVLRRLCHDTGGVAFFPPKGASIEAVMAQIARDLRGQYMLGYVPPAKAEARAFHRLEVKVSAPGRGTLHVRSRAGYSAVPSSTVESGRSAP
ncbi:MAG TPA: VWA domain-containing protein [Candidatus Acidoferrum sp.]|nr:VWA domain-containing protein [Candidatus Acidoferrum sp.]